MQIQNHSDISPHKCQNGYHKKLKVTSAVKDLEETEPSHTVGGNVNQHSHYGKQCGSISSKSNQENYHTIQHPMSQYISEGNEVTISKGIFTLIFIVAVFTIAKMWNQPKHPNGYENIVSIYHVVGEGGLRKQSLFPILKQKYNLKFTVFVQ